MNKTHEMACHFHGQQNLKLFIYRRENKVKRKLNSQKDKQIIKKVRKIFDAILKEIQKQLLPFIIYHKVFISN